MGDSISPGFDPAGVAYDSNGLVPAIVQEASTGEVLMMAWMNPESLALTLSEGYTCFWSRSRKTLWRKGETSGNRQRVVSVSGDCDGDTLLILVETDGGPACHNGTRSCFGPAAGGLGALAKRDSDIIGELFEVVRNRKENPLEGSYTTYLFTKGQDKILKKVGEETSEVIIASKNNDAGEIVYEMGDLFYHAMVLLAHHGITPDDLFAELRKRRK